MRLCLILLACLATTLSLPPEKLNSSPRIIGGKNATAFEFPYAAAINKHTLNGVIFCAGTLLGQRWILTAGQCVANAISFNIQLGSTKLSSPDPNRVIVSTSTFVLHPDYNPTTLENDIGLIELRIPLFYTDYLKPIGGLPLSSLPDFVTVSALGWGATSDTEEGPVNELQWVPVTSVTNAECALTYGSQVTDSMVCVAGNNNEGTCLGDVGGPIIQHYSGGIATVVGIASFHSGNGCESADPSGYTRIYMFNTWIKNVTGLF